MAQFEVLRVYLFYFTRCKFSFYLFMCFFLFEGKL